MTRHTTTVKFIFTLALLEIGSINTEKDTCSVSWKTSSPLILGNDIKLECSFIGKKCTGTYKWVGGPTNNVITLKNIVLDHEKYSIDITMEGKYDLVIKDLSVRDLNVFYVCHCGFYNFRDDLRQGLTTLNRPHNMTHSPVPEQRELSTTDNSLAVNLGPHNMTHSPVPEQRGPHDMTHSPVPEQKDSTVLSSLAIGTGVLVIVIIIIGIIVCLKRYQKRKEESLQRKSDVAAKALCSRPYFDL